MSCLRIIPPWTQHRLPIETTYQVPRPYFLFSNYNHPRNGGSGKITDPFNLNSPNEPVDFIDY
ncbi:hypothetical protein PPL_07845 [Heterostelium album PN500]|uniref:Uncharacterized protein n=1 Tax=Heterostelium pallidum (strain ATCC 26659 / Pp 5 / PN500) TaxID=670386 RepID=D3BH43_HETP5|nr:hypothetical protein PPL_07845 [Heterostelium album PN500]EFA79427.1 hypothetical protein PPL_07845 [Heterostelium album PN500]|eukprot:XP_020431548.1 hypothetical protein PPL_07845 [Heterostelium album PN500]